MESKMTGYISRDAACANRITIQTKEYGSIEVTPVDVIADIPAADVREVVLCRDCRYYRQSNFVDKHMECARSGFPVHPVDFCSLADMGEEQT